MTNTTRLGGTTVGGTAIINNGAATSGTGGLAVAVDNQGATLGAQRVRVDVYRTSAPAGSNAPAASTGSSGISVPAAGNAASPAEGRELERAFVTQGNGSFVLNGGAVASGVGTTASSISLPSANGAESQVVDITIDHGRASATIDGHDVPVSTTSAPPGGIQLSGDFIQNFGASAHGSGGTALYIDNRGNNVRGTQEINIHVTADGGAAPQATVSGQPATLGGLVVAQDMNQNGGEISSSKNQTDVAFDNTNAQIGPGGTHYDVNERGVGRQ